MQPGPGECRIPASGIGCHGREGVSSYGSSGSFQAPWEACTTPRRTLSDSAAVRGRRPRVEQRRFPRDAARGGRGGVERITRGPALHRALGRRSRTAVQAGAGWLATSQATPSTGASCCSSRPGGRGNPHTELADGGRGELDPAGAGGQRGALGSSCRRAGWPPSSGSWGRVISRVPGIVEARASRPWLRGPGAGPRRDGADRRGCRGPSVKSLSPARRGEAGQDVVVVARPPEGSAMRAWRPSAVGCAGADILAFPRHGGGQDLSAWRAVAVQPSRAPQSFRVAKARRRLRSWWWWKGLPPPNDQPDVG